jgi:uncharacterized protein with beta-barrel porin domain
MESYDGKSTEHSENSDRYHGQRYLRTDGRRNRFSIRLGQNGGFLARGVERQLQLGEVDPVQVYVTKRRKTYAGSEGCKLTFLSVVFSKAVEGFFS